MIIRLIIKEIKTTAVRFKTASVVMLLGLVLAYTVMMIIFIQVFFEFSYNRSFRESDNIYRLEVYDPDSGGLSPYLPGLFPEVAAAQIPDLKNHCIFSEPEQASVMMGEGGKKVFYTENAGVADTGIVSVFDLKILAGDYRQALSDKNCAFLPASIAKRVFGKINPVGEIFFINGEGPLAVTAVYEDIPSNSSFRNAIYSSYRIKKNWSNWIYHNYFRVGAGKDIAGIEGKISRLKEYEIYICYDKGIGKDLRLRPLKEVYFASEGSRSVVLALFFVGLLIIFIALINFINFITSLAPVRVRNYNIRKIYGTSTARLRALVLAESVFFSVIAFLISLIICELLAGTSVQELVDTSLSPVQNIRIVFYGLTGSIFLGLLTGIYPAFYMTNFQPAVVLKVSAYSEIRGFKIRNFLVWFQYLVSVILLIITLIMSQQMKMIQNRSWGIEWDDTIFFKMDKELAGKKEILSERLMSLPGVRKVTFSSNIWGNFFWGDGLITVKGKKTNIGRYYTSVTADFPEFWGIRIKNGKDYFNEYDTCAVINEEFDSLLDSDNEELFSKKVYGVTVTSIAFNFNCQSLKEKIVPVALLINGNDLLKYCFIKVDPAGISRQASIMEIAGDLSPAWACEVIPVKNYINNLYAKELRFSKLFRWFCIVSVLLSLSGLMGLVILNLKMKSREIAIRKVQGATAGEVIKIFNKIYIRLCLTAFIIGAPVSWCAVSVWLENFAYKISFPLWVFVLSGFLMCAVTAGIVTWQSFYTARSNPAESLR